MGPNRVQRLLRPVQSHSLRRHRIETLLAGLLHGAQRPCIALHCTANAAGTHGMWIAGKPIAPFRLVRPGRWPEVREHIPLALRLGLGPEIVEDAARLLGHLAGDLRDALLKTDTVSFSKEASGIGLGVILRHILGPLARECSGKLRLVFERSEEHTSELQSLMSIS